MDMPWYFQPYARFSLIYAKTTGNKTCLFPKSLYLKENNNIPITVYLKKCIEYGNIFTVYGKCHTPHHEDLMHNDCIRFMEKLNWELVAHEWMVYENNSHMGQGDLVFKNENTYCVIECKRRTNSKVYEQSQYYGSSWKLKYAKQGENVLYGIWTPKTQQLLGVLSTDKDAITLYKHYHKKRLRY